MEDNDLSIALSDLVEAIQGITLGGIEPLVIQAAGVAMIENWNDHNGKDNQISRGMELSNWEDYCKDELGIQPPPDLGRCPCGEDH